MSAQENDRSKEIVDRRDLGNFLSRDFFPGMIEGMGFGTLEGLTAQGLTDAVFADIQRLHGSHLTDEILLISSLPKYMLSHVPQRLWQQVNEVKKITGAMKGLFDDGDAQAALVAGPDMDLKLRLRNGNSLTDIFNNLLASHESATINQTGESTYEVKTDQSPWMVTYELINTITSNSSFGRLRMIYSYDDTRIFHADVTAFGQDNRSLIRDARIGLTSDVQDFGFALLDVKENSISCQFRQKALDVMKSDVRDAIPQKQDRTKEELAESVLRALRYAIELKPDTEFDVNKFMPWFSANSAFNIIRRGFREHLHEGGSFEFSQEKLHIIMKELIVMLVENPFDAIKALRDIAMPFIPYLADFTPKDWNDLNRDDAFLAEEFTEIRDGAWDKRDAKFVAQQRAAYIDGNFTDGFSRFVAALKDKFRKSRKLPVDLSDEDFFAALWKDGFRSYKGYSQERVVTIVASIIKTEDSTQLREIINASEDMNLCASLMCAILDDNPGGLTRDEIGYIYSELPNIYTFGRQSDQGVLLYLKKLGLINRMELGRITTEGKEIRDIGFYYSRNTAVGTTRLIIRDEWQNNLVQAVELVNGYGIYLEEAVLALSNNDIELMEMNTQIRSYLTDAIDLLKKHVQLERAQRLYA